MKVPQTSIIGRTVYSQTGITEAVLVCQGCHNKVTQEINFLTLPEALSPRSRCQQNWFETILLSWPSSPRVLMVFHLCVCVQILSSSLFSSPLPSQCIKIWLILKDLAPKHSVPCSISSSFPSFLQQVSEFSFLTPPYFYVKSLYGKHYCFVFDLDVVLSNSTTKHQISEGHGLFLT